MALLHYCVDLRSVSVEERERILELLDQFSVTGSSISKKPFVFTFFLDESEDINQIEGLPLSLIHRIP